MIALVRVALVALLVGCGRIGYPEIKVDGRDAAAADRADAPVVDSRDGPSSPPDLGVEMAALDVLSDRTSPPPDVAPAIPPRFVSATATVANALLTISLPHTVGAGLDRYLVVGVAMETTE